MYGFGVAHIFIILGCLCNIVFVHSTKKYPLWVILTIPLFIIVTITMYFVIYPYIWEGMDSVVLFYSSVLSVNTVVSIFRYGKTNSASYWQMVFGCLLLEISDFILSF